MLPFRPRILGFAAVPFNPHTDKPEASKPAPIKLRRVRTQCADAVYIIHTYDVYKYKYNYKYKYKYIYIYIWCPAPLMYLLFCVLHFLNFTYLVGRLREHSLVLVVYLMCCLLVLLVLWQMGQHYSVLIRGPAGLDPIRGYWIRQDRRLKIEDAWESFWGIFNLQSSIQAGIGSNTRVLAPIPEYSTSIPVQVKN